MGVVGDDARMTQRGEQLGLTGESLGFVRARVRLQQLERDRLAGMEVAGAVDRTHPAAAGERLEDEALCEALAGRRCGEHRGGPSCWVTMRRAAWKAQQRLSALSCIAKGGARTRSWRSTGGRLLVVPPRATSKLGF